MEKNPRFRQSKNSFWNNLNVTNFGKVSPVDANLNKGCKFGPSAAAGNTHFITYPDGKSSGEPMGTGWKN
jgi:hypothetical protein